MMGVRVISATCRLKGLRFEVGLIDVCVFASISTRLFGLFEESCQV